MEIKEYEFEPVSRFVVDVRPRDADGRMQVDVKEKDIAEDMNI